MAPGDHRTAGLWSIFSNYQTMPELGWDAVAVPGGVTAWAEHSRRFGKHPFMQLFEPASVMLMRAFWQPQPLQLFGRMQLFVSTLFLNLRKYFYRKEKHQGPETFSSRPKPARTLKKIAETGGETF
jgi:gamma-glutamyltranspeptidase/glutathione hydrolase